jgi:exopolysaccharide biosynthesis polyprenyl glycosylphosphotransferase
MASFFFNNHNPGKRRTVIASAGTLGHDVVAMFKEYSSQAFTLVGCLDDSPCERSNGLPMLGPLESARQVIREHSVDDVVIIMPHHARLRLNQMLADLQQVPVEIRIMPDPLSLTTFRAIIDDFDRASLRSSGEPALDSCQRWVKRAMDLVLGSIALVLALPIMIVVGIAIAIDSPGSIVFRQWRVGQNGKLFRMYKFRSMIRDAEAHLNEVIEWAEDGHVIHKKRDDCRVTRIGRFIRTTSLDELPQLLNVLKGEMSLVGPRPELPWLVAQYEPWQHKRFLVPQGITGWWQVNGRSDELMHKHTERDIYYVQNFSLLLDLWILWKTVGVVVRGFGAF